MEKQGMLVSGRQPPDHREALHVGWFQYRRLWVAEEVERIHSWVRESAGPAAGPAGKAVSDATVRSFRATSSGTAALGRRAANAIMRGWRATASAAAAVGRGLSAAGRGVERIRPRPFGDAALLVFMAFVAVGSLAGAGTLSFALSAWLKTSPQDVLLASAGAVVVGALFTVLMFLVFTSKKGPYRRPRRYAAQRLRPAPARQGGAIPRSGEAAEIVQTWRDAA